MRSSFYALFFVLVSFLLQGCSETQLLSHVYKSMDGTPKSVGRFKVGSPYKIDGKWYYPKETYNEVETGIASWYGPNFHGKKTANGETFNKYELTAAHRTLQMPSIIRVTNLDNGRSVVLRVNDRGPFARNRVLDVSERGAELLGYKNKGTAKVKIEVLEEESRMVANAAKRGLDTRGSEIAMNEQHLKSVDNISPSLPKYPSSVQYASNDANAWGVEQAQGGATYSGSPVGQVEQVQLSPLSGATPETTPVSAPQGGNGLQNVTLQWGDKSINPEPVTGHINDGNFMPDAVVKTVPVTPSRIYVQAGAFTVEDNAVRLSQQLSSIGQSNVYTVDVNGRTFYRVRLGPIDSVSEADMVFSKVIGAGHSNAQIIVAD